MSLKKLLIFMLITCGIGIFIYIENNLISYTNINVQSTKLPKNFDGYKIVQISDLHSKVFWRNNNILVSNIKKTKPDMIFITGDLIDRRNYDEKKSIAFIKKIKDIAPIYYVTGNHEEWSGKFSTLEEKLKENNIKVLKNEKHIVKRGGETVVVLGIKDPTNISKIYGANEELSIARNFIEAAMIEVSESDFKILLSHRPELFELYVEKKIDITFSGHAHGGQLRMPFIGGIVAPNQGFFPKYTAGKYRSGDSIMIVSRGLGRSIIPIRIFNRPQVNIVTMNCREWEPYIK